MRLLARNKKTIYYRNQQSVSEIVDTTSGSAIYSGEHTATYTAISSVKAYVKSALGNRNIEPFGIIDSKSRVIYMDMPCSMNELSQVWVDIDPTIVDGVPTVAHNYNVKGVAVGLNHVRVLIEKVPGNV